MENLPKKALSNVAAYLEKTTRALLAVALSAPSSSWGICGGTKTPSNASKIVMSNPYYLRRWSRTEQYEETWEHLDLGDVDKSLRAKLTDGDVCGILVCISAKNNLKRLQLPHCIIVRGNGLAPLRDSVVLEQINLSLEYYSQPITDPKPMISEDTVVPILQSILDKDGNSLKYLHLPKVWKVHQSEMLSVFLETYNRVLNNSKLGCSKCDGICLGTSQDALGSTSKVKSMVYKTILVTGAKNTFVVIVKSTMDFNSVLAVK